MPHSNTRSIFSTILVTIVFCIGALISSSGLIGGPLSFINDSLAVLLGLFLFVANIVVLVIALTKHKVSLLRWGQKLLFIFAATGVVCITTIIEYAIIGLDKNRPITYLIFGVIILLYGIAIEVVAIW